ncbi:MAG TPA: transporter substrate-binding domain-containing protein [Balneolaceae bacterium]|nr:transporter substrate-binding domain-containing protein [Balneolaceae bacterium]
MMLKNKISQHLSIAFCIVLIITSCTNKRNKTKRNLLQVTVHEPVERDWKAIKKEGILRIITRYSSNTYFLHQGREYGFEYEMLKHFADKHNLALEVVVMNSDDNPYDLLNSGTGDIIAANYAITDVRKEIVDFTEPYNFVSQLFVFSKSLNPTPQSLQEIDSRNIPITVRANSSYYHRLLALNKEGYSFNINLVPNNNHTEALLIDVSQEKIMATIADDNIFRVVDNYMNNLKKGPVIHQKDKIAWAVRKNASDLKKMLNDFITQQFRIEDGRVKRSAFLNILRNRYFNRGKRMAQYYYPGNITAFSGVISPFDEIFKQIGDSLGIDWLMLAAIAAQESQFNPNATGWANAIGLMQVMPLTASVDSSALFNPKTNIRQAARILNYHLKRLQYIPESEQWPFVLAAYNIGQGHLADARRLAIDFNQNPNEWENVADAFLRLMNRKYFKNARYGFCRGVITVKYVREIMNRYENYKTILKLASASRLES